MKKVVKIIISVLLSVILILPASAADIIPGDINGDGEVKAADARLALRFAAKVESPDTAQFTAADIDSNGKITAADARRILRIAARIDTGDAPAEIEIPADVKAFTEGTYYITGAIWNNSGKMNIATASDGKSVQMTSYIDNMQFSILHLDGNAYVLLPQKKSYTELTEQLMKALGVEGDASDFTDLGPEEEPSEVLQQDADINGKQGTCTAYVFRNEIIMFFCIGDKLIQIEQYNKTGELLTIIEVDTFTTVIPSGWLTLRGYRHKNIQDFISDFISI